MKLVIFFLLISINSIAQVEIKRETSLYYLEVEDKYYMELVKDSMQVELINGLRTESELKTQIIENYKDQKSTYESIIVTKDEEISFNKKEVKRLKKDRTKERIGFGAVIVLLILAI